MKFILISIAVMATAYVMGISRNSALRWLGQGILLALTLAVAAGALFCLFFPLAKPETGSGVMILAVIPLILAGLAPWTLLRLARDVIVTRDFTPAQRDHFIKEDIDNLEADIESQLVQDTKDVNKFWISSAKRRRLRQNISHNRFMLAGFKKMETEMQKTNNNHGEEK